MCDCEVWSRVGHVSTISLCFLERVCACFSVYVRAIKAGPVPCTNTALVLPLSFQLGLTDKHTQRHREGGKIKTPNSGWEGTLGSHAHVLRCGIWSFRRLPHTFNSSRIYKTQSNGSKSKNMLLY